MAKSQNMTFGTKIQILSEFGKRLNKKIQSYYNRLESAELTPILQRASARNPWFTTDNVLYALKYWVDVLTEDRLEEWLNKYPNLSEVRSLEVGVVTAGNIPLVGLHDLICVYLSGHKALVKTSSDDPVLTHWFIQLLAEVDPHVNQQIRFIEKLEKFDAVIATGSNNSARYFEYYFGKVPHIIRKNRNSAAVITNETTDEELRLLADDVFRYFGLGCRSVSKLYLPDGFDLQRIFAAFYHWHPIIQHHRYASNYDYNRVVYLMSKEKILDNGFFILRPNGALASPVSVVHYEYYSDLPTLKSHLTSIKDQLQCVVGRSELATDDFGCSQRPSISKYADDVDTLAFLLSLH